MFTLDIEDTSKLYFTSDSHFSHYNICRYCNRPFASRSDMDNTLINNWNSVVPEDGIVVHCGDFMLSHDGDIKDYMKYLYRLNGRVLLIRGNHDRVELAQSNDKLINVVDMANIVTPDAKLFASHYPCLAFNGDYQVFGHIHTLSNGKCTGSDGYVTELQLKNQYDVGVDQNGYTPVSFDELMKIFKKRCKK